MNDDVLLLTWRQAHTWMKTASPFWLDRFAILQARSEDVVHVETADTELSAKSVRTVKNEAGILQHLQIRARSIVSMAAWQQFP